MVEPTEIQSELRELALRSGTEENGSAAPNGTP
jgi:hypothetical protein